VGACYGAERVRAPRLSICIPTYERLGYLREAVASAQAQTIADIEIVISDDGNSEKLAAWARGAALDDPRISYFKNAERLGLAANWEACARRARGEYVTLMGDDDRLRPTFAERLLEAAEGGVDVVFANHYVIDAAGQVSDDETASVQRRFRRDEMTPGPLSDPEPWVWRNSIPMSSAIIRADVVRRLGFKSDLNTPEIEFYARLAREGGSFYFVSEYLAEYRSHAGSLTAGGLRLEKLFKYLELLPVGPHVEPEKRAFLREVSVAALHRSLLARDVRGARQVSRSRYYPEARFDRATIQRVFALTPLVGADAYRVVFRVGKAAATHLKRWRRSTEP
jgi:glycosyltransferase involved in cell wall biosynthesis